VIRLDCDVRRSFTETGMMPPLTCQLGLFTWHCRRLLAATIDFHGPDLLDLHPVSSGGGGAHPGDGLSRRGAGSAMHGRQKRPRSGRSFLRRRVGSNLRGTAEAVSRVPETTRRVLRVAKFSALGRRGRISTTAESLGARPRLEVERKFWGEDTRGGGVRRQKTIGDQRKRKVIRVCVPNSRKRAWTRSTISAPGSRRFVVATNPSRGSTAEGSAGEGDGVAAVVSSVGTAGPIKPLTGAIARRSTAGPEAGHPGGARRLVRRRAHRRRSSGGPPGFSGVGCPTIDPSAE